MLYGRSDLRSVNIGEGHGGCGQTHVRPRDAAGEFVQPWALVCAACENFLRNDTQMWAATIAEVPETHDEAKAREQIAARGGADRDAILVQALAKIAGIEVPSSLTRALPAAAPVRAMLACPAGHAQPAGQAFCGQCGASMRSPAPAGEIGAGAPR